MLLLPRVGEFVARRSGRRKGGSRSDPVAAPPAPRTAAPRAVAHIALPAPDVQQFEAEARYHRDRLALYRARVLSAKPASAARLRELERISTAADARLRHAAKRDGAEGTVNQHGAL
jgi:hypothetical protein